MLLRFAWVVAQRRKKHRHARRGGDRWCLVRQCVYAGERLAPADAEETRQRSARKGKHVDEAEMRRTAELGVAI